MSNKLKKNSKLASDKKKMELNECECFEISAYWRVYQTFRKTTVESLTLIQILANFFFFSNYLHKDLANVNKYDMYSIFMIQGDFLISLFINILFSS